MMPVWFKNAMKALAAIILTAAGMTDVRAGFFYRKKADRMSKIPLRLISPSPIEHFSGSHCVKVVETQVVWIESFNETFVRCQSVPVRFHEMPGAAYLLLVRPMKTNRFVK